MSRGPPPMRPRSQTSSTRPRSNYMLLSSLDRRTSLGAADLRRMWAWPPGDAPAPRACSVPVGGQDTQQHMELRRCVAHELYATEKRYVAGLQAMDALYYAPLYHALEHDAVVSRGTLNRMFSNFVDILQLSCELLFRLEERLGGSAAWVAQAPGTGAAAGLPSAARQEARGVWDPCTDQLGDLLLPIAPFFKMYTLFMQNFAGALQCIDEERAANARFDAFVRSAETRARTLGWGVELGLQAQLLTVVQRVPRYRLLLQQLLHATPPEHADHAALQQAYCVVDHVASSINEQVRQQELTLVALALQRVLLGLDEPLVVPGRRLLRHGTLLKTRRKNIQPRHVYLFSDCILLASAASVLGDAPPPLGDACAEETLRWSDPAPLTVVGGPALYLTHKLPLAECTVVAYDEPAPPALGLPLSMSMPDLSANMGRAPLQLRHRFDLHSPQCSFSLYAATAAAKHAWIAAIREAHAEHMAALRSLRKAESPPGRASSCSSRSSASRTSTSASALRSPTPPPATPCTTTHAMAALLSPRKDAAALPVLEHYHPPVWVPDSFSVRCARCVEPFTLWRRKHHCRLCGQVFCASCSSASVLLPRRTPDVPDRRARACLACFASVSRTEAADGQPNTPCASPASSARLATPIPARTSREALRPVLDVPQPPASLADVTNGPRATPRPRFKHARRWSIVSVPKGESDASTPCLVQASTAGTRTLQLQEPSTPPGSPLPAPARRPAEADACSPAPAPPPEEAHLPRTRSHAAQWLQAMLHPPDALRTP